MPYETRGENDGSSRRSSKRQPLYLRLYFEPHMVELVRTLGYTGIPVSEAREKMRLLVGKYGKEKMVAAADEITEVDRNGSMARLTAEARKLAVQILGMQPAEATPDPIAGEPPAQDEAARAEPDQKTTPIMQQYREAKERHPGMLLLFRMGDFYELFDEDAKTAAKLLGLTLTTRDRTTTMAGFPHHQLETYLRKLLHAGQRVAICDQVPESLARGPIRREVNRIVTPGTLVEDEPEDPPAEASPPVSSAPETPASPASGDHAPPEPLAPRRSRSFDPEQLRAEADRAVTQANHAREHSEYPRYGESVYLELAAALRELADVTEATEDAISTPGHDRTARQTRRAAWLKRKAAFLKVQSLRKGTESHDIASRRPFGQPILVGHHSERRHRRDLERQHNKDAQAVALWKQAKDAEHAASACEQNDAIYSDDPEAPDKLVEKIAQLEERQERMKRVNTAHQKFLKNPESNWHSGLTDAEQEIVRAYTPAYSWEPHPFAPYQLKNNNANIRRLKERMKKAETLQTASERPDRWIGDIVISDNLDFQKVELRFPAKPSDEIRQKLHEWGFRWVRSAGVWSRGINAATEARLQWLAECLGQPIT